MTYKLATEKFEEFTVTELSLGKMRELQAMGDMKKDDVQYYMACACVQKQNGDYISMEELNAMGLRRVTKLLNVVSRLNGAGETVDEQGNG